MPNDKSMDVFKGLYFGELERTKRKASFRNVIIQAIMIESVIRSLFVDILAKKKKKVEKRKVNFWQALNGLYALGVFSTKEYNLIIKHRDKRNWLTHKSFTRDSSRAKLDKVIREIHPIGVKINELLQFKVKENYS